jgi:predicted RNase H-like HicB family nuclease
MRKAYPIVISEVKDVTPYSVYVPDFDAYTQGEDVAECINMARDLIGLSALSLKEDFNEPVPAPGSVKFKNKDSDILTLVDVDFEKYQREHDTRPFKKTVNIPRYLNTLGVEKGLNFSKILTDALHHELKA